MSTSTLKEARRAPGSEWLKDHPGVLERVYVLARRMAFRAYPVLRRINRQLAERLMVQGEAVAKGWAFNCQMCGQCILHSTGMTCPMTCPKNLRNGPCGGVRPDGHCEVIPERPCVWVQAWQRSQAMTIFVGEMQVIQPPVNRALQNTASWVNMVEGRDTQLPQGWDPPPLEHTQPAEMRGWS